MSITDLFLMIIQREIIHDKPSCEGILTYTAPKMNLQNVAFLDPIESLVSTLIIRVFQCKSVILEECDN